MQRIRVIPVLLLRKGGLYKSVRFKNYKYVGDPINAVRIFNEKEVDEIVILDIEASVEQNSPDLQRIKEIAGEAFMPLAYGGGIASVEDVKKILYAGVEKVVLNYSAVKNPDLIREIARQFGSSSVVVSIDVKKDWLGRKKVFLRNGTENTGLSPVELAKRMEDYGAGEIFLTSIDADGTYTGYDTSIINEVSRHLSIPVVACGGASELSDFHSAVVAGASAVAAGSMFVFQRPHNAVLISYPSQKDLTDKLYSKI